MKTAQNVKKKNVKTVQNVKNVKTVETVQMYRNDEDKCSTMNKNCLK